MKRKSGKIEETEVKMEILSVRRFLSCSTYLKDNIILIYALKNINSNSRYFFDKFLSVYAYPC